MGRRIPAAVVGPVVTALGGGALVVGTFLPWSATPFDDGVTQYWTVFSLRSLGHGSETVLTVVAILSLVLGLALIALGLLRLVRTASPIRSISVGVGVAAIALTTWSVFPIRAFWLGSYRPDFSGIEPIAYGLVVSVFGGIYAVLGGLIHGDETSEGTAPWLIGTGIVGLLTIGSSALMHHVGVWRFHGIRYGLAWLAGCCLVIVTGYLVVIAARSLTRDRRGRHPLHEVTAGSFQQGIR